MKRKFVEELFIDEDERKKKVIFYSSFIIVLSLVCIIFTYFALKNTRIKYVNYQEDSSVHYKVYLKDNEFFDNSYLEENQQYITDVMDYINSEFQYHLVMGDAIRYEYNYKINAVVDIVEKNSSNKLFHYEDLIVPEKKYHDVSLNNTDILEQVNVDYHKYDDMVRKFIEVYDLDNVDANLSVQLVVDVGCEEDKEYNTSTISLNVPLAVKTVSIEVESDATEHANNVLAYHPKDSVVLLLICLIIFCIDVMFIVRFIQFSMNSRSVRDIYEQQLRKILTNYHSYIQKISNEFEFKGYQVLYVNEFTDLLEIRETISEPILMATDPNNKATFFIVPSSTKILYVYSVRIKDIKRELKDIQDVH